MEIMKRLLSTSILIALVSCLTGCMSYTGGVSPSSTPLEGRTYTVLNETYGNDNTWYLFGIIPLGTTASSGTALKTAIDKQNGDALINITSDGYNYDFILLGRHKTTIRGVAIKFTDGKPVIPIAE